MVVNYEMGVLLKDEFFNYVMVQKRFILLFMS